MKKKEKTLLEKANYWQGYLDGKLAILKEWESFLLMSEEKQLSWARQQLFNLTKEEK